MPPTTPPPPTTPTPPPTTPTPTPTPTPVPPVPPVPPPPPTPVPPTTPPPTTPPPSPPTTPPIPPSPTPPSPTPPSPTPPSPTPPSPTPPSPTPPSPTPPSPTPTPPPAPIPVYPAAINSFSPSESPIGTGTAFLISQSKDASFTFKYKDIYDNVIDNELQLAQQIADFSYRVSLYTTGAAIDNMSPYLVSGDFATNQQALNFKFPQTKNAELFGSSGAQRYYNLLINVKNEGLENSVLTTVYHIPAKIDSVDIQDFYSGVTGRIDFSLTFGDQSVTNYITRSVDVYTGANTGNEYSTSGYSFFKNVAFLNNAAVQDFSLFAGEIPNNTNIYYQFVPYDDFGNGFVYSGGVSGYLMTEIELLNYEYGIPPILNFEDRTGLYFSGLSSPQDSFRDGSLVYQTGASGQDLYLVKSGQWKKIFSEDRLCKFVSPPVYDGDIGSVGEFSISGEYFYAATGENLWGRILLTGWMGELPTSFSINLGYNEFLEQESCSIEPRTAYYYYNNNATPSELYGARLYNNPYMLNQHVAPEGYYSDGSSVWHVQNEGIVDLLTACATPPPTTPPTTPPPTTPPPTTPPPTTPPPTTPPTPVPTPVPTPSPTPPTVGPFSFTLATGSGPSVNINWSAAENASNYGIFRSEDDVTYSPIYNGNDYTYNDSSVLGGGSGTPNYYFYYMVGYGVSDYTTSTQNIGVE